MEDIIKIKERKKVLNLRFFSLENKNYEKNI
jgi:hypothetical protein